ncbi:MAG: VCBS repeat-containing protein [Candidatus Hydrogenedentes bacterium]|nr:VCBS repeat-containing protein [Candidatus Hydrogenedentota bacterium]
MGFRILLTVLCLSASATAFPTESRLERILYNQPGLVVDLGVGLWAHPLPMDYDADGDFDMVVATPDVPYNGVYFFENTEGDVRFPVFKAARRVCKPERNMTVSYVGDTPYVMVPNKVFPNFRKSALDRPETLPYQQDFYAGRANQWKYCDYDGDGVIDLIVGVSDWRGYGWDDAYNEKGEWTHEPLHGYVYFIRNEGANDVPAYASAVQVMAGGRPIDVFGCPSPNFADFDADGDLDLICGEFLDKFTYFENTGTRTAPAYAAGRRLERKGAPIAMDLEMLQVIAVDWDKDGDADLIVGQEDGRVALLEHTGATENGMPAFLPPRFFQQEADAVKIGVLCTPFSVDWDADGDEDLFSGDTAGYINFVENRDGGNPPKFAPPVYLQAGGETIHIQAGPNGSIQGPAEAKWGYTVLNVCDWDADGLLDIVLNSIWGKVLWHRGTGTRTAPMLEAARPIEVAWSGPTPKPEWLWWNPEGRELVTQWRTTPFVIDLNVDNLPDLVMLDTEGYLAYFERRRQGETLLLLPPQRIFLNESLEPLRLNDRRAGKSGRRKFCMADWDRDGRIDILVDGKNIDFLRNVGDAAHPWVFRNEGMLDSRVLAGHDTCPAAVDWDRNGVPDLLIGAEDGFLYYLRNPMGP